MRFPTKSIGLAVVKRCILSCVFVTECTVPDPFPPMGLEANRAGLQLAIDWALEQKIIPRRLSVDELFDETTAALD